MLKVKLLDPNAIIPTVAHPGEDLGYDLYSLDDGDVYGSDIHTFHTGVAVEFKLDTLEDLAFGFIIKERSSQAKQGISILGGVIDAGYRGELLIVLANHNRPGESPYHVRKGDKIGNLIPIPVAAKKVSVVSDLALSLRGDGGFGSTGR